MFTSDPPELDDPELLEVAAGGDEDVELDEADEPPPLESEGLVRNALADRLGRMATARRRLRNTCNRPREVAAMQNLIQNRRLIVGLVLAILIAAVIVLIIAYSGGGHGVGGGY